MAERIRVEDLLGKARHVYDAPNTELTHLAAGAWKSAFASGGDWMGRGLACLRGRPIAGPRCGLNRLGLIKYGLASGGALLCVALAIVVGNALLLIMCVPVFYAIEAQMVFLFPLALDGSAGPFRESRVWTRQAGGTLEVMRLVLPIAVTMLFGGFVGRGFVRSWCIGCLAVCVWYELLRIARRGTFPEQAVRPC